MVEFSSQVLRVFIMTINNKSERNFRGKCLGWPVTSYGGDSSSSGEKIKPYYSSIPRIIRATELKHSKTQVLTSFFVGLLGLLLTTKQ